MVFFFFFFFCIIFKTLPDDIIETSIILKKKKILLFFFFFFTKQINMFEFITGATNSCKPVKKKVYKGWQFGEDPTKVPLANPAGMLWSCRSVYSWWLF